MGVSVVTLRHRTVLDRGLQSASCYQRQFRGIPPNYRLVLGGCFEFYSGGNGEIVAIYYGMLTITTWRI